MPKLRNGNNGGIRTRTLSIASLAFYLRDPVAFPISWYGQDPTRMGRRWHTPGIERTSVAVCLPKPYGEEFVVIPPWRRK